MREKYRLHGIDVSHHQAPERMDWKFLEGQVEFLIARACYGELSDATFEKHILNARAHDLAVGGYIFYRQTQRWEKQFARFRVELERVGYGPGDILPVVDLEWNIKFDGPVNATILNSEGRALVEAVADLYGGCLIYTAPGFFPVLGKPAWLLEHPLWIAHIGVPQPTSFKAWEIWQYDHEGRLAGYSGKLDLNVADRLPLIPVKLPVRREEIATIPELPVVEDLDADPFPVITYVESENRPSPIISIVAPAPTLTPKSWWGMLWLWLRFIFTSR